MNDLLLQAQKEIDRAKQYLTDNENALFTMHDLKLHDVSYYCYTDFVKDFPLLAQESGEYNEFHAYCDVTFDTFQEDIKAECNADFETLAHYIGHTSKFYLNDFDSYGNDPGNAIEYLFYELADLWRTGIDLQDNQQLYIMGVDIDEYGDAIRDDLTEIINNFYNMTVEHCAPFIRCYEILKAFKDNQVSDFKEFCSYHETELQEQREKEIAQEKADNETIRALIDKYSITPDDVKTIKTTIYAL